ncbi:MAG TPA: 6-pyruvoyl-tetrahydropterin synthase-related protein [Chloroflexota bacterium]|nr:6-pyruvoyl-tetrahydropterin synthase-related protein [Chloroflexota bacterium]
MFPATCLASSLGGGLARLLSWLLATLAVWPAISRLFEPGFVATYDGIWHLSRQIEVDQLVRQGSYPRWLPDAGLGHGIPLFNYFPPLSYLLAEVPALAGFSLPLALQIAAASSFLVAAWGMYALARQLGAGPWGSATAAALYTYIPFHLQDLYSRGAFPELWGMAWLPWAAWALVALARQPTLGWLAGAGVLVAATVTSHNVVALEGLPLAALLAVLAAAGVSCRLALGRTGLGLLAGATVSAGYWLPALAELNLAHVSQLEARSWQGSTLPLTRLISADFFARYGSQTYQLHLPQALLLLLLVVAVGLVATRERDRWAPAIGLSVALALLLFLLSRSAVPVWQHLPLASFTQFPWRLLVVIGLGQAMMAALLAAWWRWSVLGLLPLVVLLGWSALGQVPPSRFPDPLISGSAALLKQEYGSGSDGKVVDSEYLPATANPQVLKFGHGPTVSGTLPSLPPVQVHHVQLGANAWQMEVTAPAPTRVLLQPFFFPGWSATVDGRAVRTEPGSPAGFVELPVPAGSHHVALWYSGTPIERWTGWLSLAALAWCLVAMAGPWRGALLRLRRGPGRPGSVALSHQARAGAAVGIASLALVGAGAIISGAQQPATVALAAANWSPAPGADSLLATTPPRLTKAGIAVALYWLDSGSTNPPSFSFVARGVGGNTIRRWPAASALVLPREYSVPNEIEKRQYLLTGLPATAERVSLVIQGDGGTQALGSLFLPAAAPFHMVSLNFDGLLGLTGYRVERLADVPGLVAQPLPTRADAALQPGDFFLVQVRWQALRPPDHEEVAFVHLLDAQGHTWATQDNQPDATLQPVSAWTTGSTVDDRYLLRLNSAAPPGMYRLEMGLYRAGFQFLRVNGGNSALFGEIKVRPATPPPAPPAGAVQWHAPIALAGWHASGNASHAQLTFQWAALGNVAGNYTLFVHLLDAQGRLAYQADAPPQSGLFPTSLWEAGDRVTDIHRLPPVVPGRYDLQIGWYQPRTDQRLPLASGGSTLNLGSIAFR